MALERQNPAIIDDRHVETHAVVQKRIGVVPMVIAEVPARFLAECHGQHADAERDDVRRAQIAERERDVAAREAVVEERARIARELHDAIAHNVSMMVIQAGAERRTLDEKGGTTREVLETIERIGRGALTEMRRLLGVLREDAEQDTASEPVLQPAGPGRQPAGPGRRPQPGLPQLGDLVDDAREASGGVVRLIMSGQADRLDPGVELAAYRIVQEALTNARRHAPGAAVDVELRYADDALRLRIRDNGPGQAPRYHAGHGLLGMRERAAAVGGSLQTGDARGGGFCVEAELPAKVPDAMTGRRADRTHP